MLPRELRIIHAAEEEEAGWPPWYLQTLCGIRVTLIETLPALYLLRGDYIFNPEGRCKTCLALAALRSLNINQS